MNISSIVGLIGVFGLVASAIAMGGLFSLYVNIPSILIVAGIAIGAGFIAFGIRDMLDTVAMFRILLVTVPPAALTPRHAEVIRGLIAPTYGAGVIGVLIGAIQLLATIDDPQSVGGALAVVLLTLLYATVLAEGLLRPTARLIEGRLKGV